MNILFTDESASRHDFFCFKHHVNFPCTCRHKDYWIYHALNLYHAQRYLDYQDFGFDLVYLGISRKGNEEELPVFINKLSQIDKIPLRVVIHTNESFSADFLRNLCASHSLEVCFSPFPVK